MPLRVLGLAQTIAEIERQNKRKKKRNTLPLDRFVEDNHRNVRVGEKARFPFAFHMNPDLRHRQHRLCLSASLSSRAFRAF